MSEAKTLRVAIFGATSGIAAALARRFAAAGARIALVGRDCSAIDAAAGDLKVRGAGEIVRISADFSELDRLPQIADVAVIAYGTLPEQADLDADPQAAVPMLSLNFVSPSVLAGHLAGRFEAQRAGVIALITSVAGDRGRKSNYFYGAAKGGLQLLAEGLRHRLYPAGVQVLDIRPGFVMTRMTDHLAHRGLLWAEPDRVAGDIQRAIARGSAVLYTPWFWRGILAIVRALPRPLFHRTSF
jgi:short-subunit dehydrogenase